MPSALSCDTSVVVGRATADRSVIFAKNSDRPPNECQPLFHAPRRRHPADAKTRCQYIEIPQVEQTWEVIGSRPYWLWGFEIGVNEWGVTVGNEAVYTREPYEDQALIGMDLVHLALERSTTAGDAVQVIGALVERYGQGGSCDAVITRTYHNSFIVADPTTAWVLETAGHRWIATRVLDRAAISNVLTIEGDWDAASPGLVKHARTKGWTDDDFNFAAAYQDPTVDLQPRVCRLNRARQVLGEHRDPVSVADMMALLRNHDGNDVPTGPQELPTICMHASPSFPGETAASMVVHLRPDRPKEVAVTCWTAFGSPCLSLFRPVYPFAVGLPSVLDYGGARCDSSSPWWEFERLQRLVAVAPTLAAEARFTLTSLESTFQAESAQVETEALHLLAEGDRDGALSRLRTLVEATTARSISTVRRLAEELAPRSAELAEPAIADFWEDLNAQVNLPDAVRVAARI